MGLIEPTKGCIKVDGQDINIIDNREFLSDGDHVFPMFRKISFVKFFVYAEYSHAF